MNRSVTDECSCCFLYFSHHYHFLLIGKWKDDKDRLGTCINAVVLLLVKKDGGVGGNATGTLVRIFILNQSNVNGKKQEQKREKKTDSLGT